MRKLKKLCNRNVRMGETSTVFQQESPLILVIDDDRCMRTLLNLAMEEEGYRVMDAKDGEQGIREYRRCQPDMVLLDAVMPGMDGFTCCQRIRELPGGDRTPILMITVLDDQDSVDQAFEAGTTDYITKPIHWAVLSQRVQRLLLAYQAFKEAQEAKSQLRQHQGWQELFKSIIEELSSVENLEVILNNTVTNLQVLLQVERVAIQTLDGKLIIEAVAPNCLPLTELSLLDPILQEYYGQNYHQGEIIAIDKISEARFPEEVVTSFEKSAVKSLLFVPILVAGKLWGVLLIHKCLVFHTWEKNTQEYLVYLSKLLAIAVYQAQLSSKT